VWYNGGELVEETSVGELGEEKGSELVELWRIFAELWRESAES
jgi:hypothetical protein